MRYVCGKYSDGTYEYIDLDTGKKTAVSLEELLKASSETYIYGVSENGKVTAYSSPESILAQYKMREKLSNSDSVLDIGFINGTDFVIKSVSGTSRDNVVMPDFITGIVGHMMPVSFSNISKSLKSLNNLSMSEQVRHIHVPDGITQIRAFCNRTKLTSVRLPSSLQKIDYRCFYNCTSLQEIMLPDALEVLGDDSFRDCTSLESIVIPDTVEYVGYSAFRGCTSLRFARLSSKISMTCSSMFKNCTSLTEVVIPNGIEVLNGTFPNCTSLREITIPPSVTKIGNGAFRGCTSLETVQIQGMSGRVTTGAFDGCPNLKRVIFKKGSMYMYKGRHYGSYDSETFSKVGRYARYLSEFPSGCEVIFEE